MPIWVIVDQLECITGYNAGFRRGPLERKCMFVPSYKVIALKRFFKSQRHLGSHVLGGVCARNHAGAPGVAGVSFVLYVYMRVVAVVVLVVDMRANMRTTVVGFIEK